MTIPLGFGRDYPGRRYLSWSTDALMHELKTLNNKRNEYLQKGFNTFYLIIHEECIKIILNHRIRKCERK